jgi:hypothetical protein
MMASFSAIMKDFCQSKSAGIIVSSLSKRPARVTGEPEGSSLAEKQARPGNTSIQTIITRHFDASKSEK